MNFIPPTPGAASKKGGHGGWNVEDVNTAPAHPMSSPHPAQPEIFQLVMDHLPRFFSGTRPPAKTKTHQTASSEATAQKKDEAGNSGAEAANGGNSPMPQTKSDLAFSPDALIPLVAHCGMAPAVTELAVAAAPFVSAEKSGNSPANWTANLKAKSSGVVAVDSGREKTNAGLTPANAVLSRILNETESEPASSSGAAKNRADLPESPPPVADGAPNAGTARSANDVSQAEPVSGVSLTSPESSENEAAVAVSGGEKPEIQKEPAIIEHLQFTNDDLRAANPSASQSQIANRKSQIANSTDGTAVAQQDATMKMAVKKTNFSGAKQKLPGATVVATGDNLPARSERKVVPATITIRVDPAMPSGTGISADDGATQSVSAEILDLPRIAPSGVPSVQRTQELVSSQVMRLQESGADVMHVVIKPDAGVQMSLRLQQHDGGVEVRAVLNRGNFDLLNRHWPELQQQLELRGVRVAPLANAEPSFGGGSEGFRQPTTSHGQHAGDDTDPAERPAVLLSGLPPATATASASTISSRRLETWA